MSINEAGQSESKVTTDGGIVTKLRNDLSTPSRSGAGVGSTTVLQVVGQSSNSKSAQIRLSRIEHYLRWDQIALSKSGSREREGSRL